jgi:glutathione S-transferase
MESLIENAAFQTYALCSAILALKMLGSAVYTAATRGRVSGYVNPEDTRFGGEGAAAAETEKPEVAHALRIQRNDLENIPLFWIVGLLYVLMGGSSLGTAVYGWTFTLSRIAHTFVYASHVQPARALLWGLGSLCILGMASQVIWRAL